MKSKTLFVIVLFCLSLSTHAQVRLPKVLGDNMVLQRNKPIQLWGWANANEKISVTFKKQTVTTKANKNGEWRLSLKPEVAGGPHQLTVKGKNTITLSNILVGEVWVCSGQSNMEWTVRNSNNAAAEINAGNYPMIRHIAIPKSVSLEPKEDIVSGEWKVCSPETVGDFTAVGYYFARELFTEINVPIGLIHTSWGGTHSETWTSREAFEKSDAFSDMIARMPTVDLDELSKQKSEALKNKLAALGIIIPPAAEVSNWNQLTYADTHWKTMTLPGLWESQGLTELDGVVWYRKNITIPTALVNQEARLHMAMIDDSDKTYINGVLVGSTTNQWNEKRMYTVKPGILKEGINIIAVRVEDTGGGGGVHGEPTDLSLLIKNTNIPLAGSWKYAVESISQGTGSIGPNSYPTLLFNAMINPIKKYTIQGAIWYQGESNAGRAYQYQKAFPLLIEDWRTQWAQGNFPFYFVQLASFNASNGTSKTGSTWAELREAQTRTLSLPNTGMAVTTDIGEANDIHPRNKQDVGKRLAALALNKVYEKGNVFSGPQFKSMRVEENKIRISFEHVGGGLLANDKYGYIKGFEIAGSDQRFVYAKAWIEGEEVVVSANEVSKPVAVRFAWADNPEDANLYNQEGFPAIPFRTDNWKGITASAVFTIE